MSEQELDEPRFVVCIRNDDYAAGLEVRKIYEVLPDMVGRAHDLLRVIDESGEDYLYPRSYFVSIDLSQAVRDALHLAA